MFSQASVILSPEEGGKGGMRAGSGTRTRAHGVSLAGALTD